MLFTKKIFYFFKILKKLKFLRNTPLNIFAYSLERKKEKQLIKILDDCINLILKKLNNNNYKNSLALIETFSDAHFNEKPFIKRKRDKLKFDNSELGKGDARVQKIADVFSSPLILKSRKDN